MSETTNILVVDDEKEIAELVEIYLVSDGYKVFKANNAMDGLDIPSGSARYYDAGHGRDGDVQKDKRDKQHTDHHAERQVHRFRQDHGTGNGS